MSKMSAENGVHGIIAHVNSKAVYVLCHSHGLNNVRLLLLKI